MTVWKLAVEKFLNQWLVLDEFEGAVLSGSYAVGMQSEKSDVDIMIVLSNATDWWQRGNLIIHGIMIEYIADPAQFWQKAFEEDYRLGRKISVSMFALGKILRDKHGLVIKLKKEAEKIMAKPFRKMKTRDIEMAKYHLWDGVEKLKSLYKRGFASYGLLYYLHLSKILGFYASFVGISLPATAKIYRFLNDVDFRGKYKLQGFNDKKFVGLVNSCLRNYASLGAIEKLNNYVLDKLGGLEINGWKLRTQIKKYR